MTKTQINTLLRKRGQIETAITAFVQIMDEWEQKEDRDADYLQVSLETVERAFAKFDKIQDQLEEMDQSEIQNGQKIQVHYNKAIARARKYLREEEATIAERTVRSSTPSPSSIPSRNSIPVTLPAITLSTFDGSVEGWTSFIDIFSALIDKNPDLSPVRKLQYLRLCLKGKSAHVIESLETTDNNYGIALSLVKNKYECTRQTLRRHWAILREYPRLQKDTPVGLSQLVDTFQQHVRALEIHKAPVDQWDIPLIDLILTKINPNTVWQWELTLNNNDMPSYQNLISFLEKRANCVDFSTMQISENGSKSQQQRQEYSRHRKSGPPMAQTYVTSSIQQATTSKENSCPICTDSHIAYRCPVFHSMSVEERQKAVSNACLCFNCLGYGHAIKNCSSKRNCHKCKKRHHTLLHQASNDRPTENPNNVNTSKGEDERAQA